MPIRKLMKAFRRLSGIPSTTDSGRSRPHMAPSVESTSEPTPSVQHTTNSQSTEQDVVGVGGSIAPRELILYGRPSCPYCARVDRAIKELGIEDKIIRRHTGFGTEWRTDLRKRTGSTQVPCLFIDGEPMFESLDIIAWLKANVI